MSEDTSTENTETCCGNKGEQEVIYSNDGYRVEKIIIQVNNEETPIYGVYNTTYEVLELETTILAKALNTADELDNAVSTFFQSKAFDNLGEDTVIATS